ncbi:acyltransferase [Tumebacillus permanentifrigoris]|nr:acyltransferase [Tumebacillus permanentifrigoris]
MEKIVKVRLNEIPHLRSVAFIAVVAQHAIGMFTRTNGINLSDLVVLSVLFNLMKFAVPMFVFITGLVIFYNYYAEIRVGSYLVKRVREIIIPYVIWAVFYYFYWAWDRADHAWHDLPSVLLTGSGYYHLWFVAMIFQFYLLYPLFRLLFKALQPYLSRERVLVPFLVVLTAFFIWSTVYLINHSSQWHSNVFGLRGFLNNFDRTFPVWYLYFVLGGVAALAIGKWRLWVAKVQGWNYVAFAIGLGWVTYELAKGINLNAKLPSQFPIYLGVSNSFKLSMILFTLSSFVLLYQWAMKWSERDNLLTKLSILIGKYSYGTFLIHALWLDEVYHVVVDYMPSYNNTVKALVAVVLCVTLSLVSTMVISKIPFLGALVVGTTGKRQKKPKVSF